MSRLAHGNSEFPDNPANSRQRERYESDIQKKLIQPLYGSFINSGAETNFSTKLVYLGRQDKLVSLTSDAVSTV